MKNPKILVIDDEPAIRRLLVEFLSPDFEVVTAETPDQLSLDNLQPDFLILDNQMPGMNGIDFLKQLRTDSDRKHLPVIMLSAQSKSAEKIAALEAGADDYLTKPFNPEELRARIRAIMRRVM